MASIERGWRNHLCWTVCGTRLDQTKVRVVLIHSPLQGILPLSGLSVQAVSLEPDTSHSPHGLEISGESGGLRGQWYTLSWTNFCPLLHQGPMMEPKVFACAGAADLQSWLQLIEDRRCRSMKQLAGPAHCALSYLVRTNIFCRKGRL